MRRLLLAGVAALGLAAPAAAQGWPMQHGNAQHTSSTSLAGFSKIRVAWTKDLGIITPAPGTKDAPQSGQGISVAPDGHLIVSASTAVYKINSATGELIWTYAPGTAHRFTQALVDANQVYIASTNLITALNQGTGAVVWQVPVSATSPAASTRVDTGGAGFVTNFSSPSAPIALVPGSSWFLITNGDAMNSTNLGSTGGALSVSTGGFIHAAKHQPSGLGFHHAAIARDGSIVFLKSQASGSGAWNIHAFAADLTTLLWSTSSVGGRAEWGMALGTGTFSNPAALFVPIYRGATGFKLRAFNMATGADIWTSTFTMNASNFEPGASFTPVYDEANHRVYLNDNTHLHAFDAANGDGLWSRPLAENAGTSPTWSIGTPLVAGSTTVLVAAIQRISGAVKPTRLWNLDSSNGDPRWSVTIASIPFGTGAIYSPAQTPQISPGSDGAFYAHIAARDTFDNLVDWRHFVARYEPANYDAVSVTTSPPAAVTGSTYVRQPAHVRVTQGGSPVSGVPVTLHTHEDGGCALTSNLIDPAGNNYAAGATSSHSYHTDASGFITMYYEYEPETMAVGCFESLQSTAVVSVPGLADAPIYLSETRVSTYTITRSSPSIEFSTTTGVMFQVSTITVSVTGAGGVPLQGVPVRLTRSNYTSLCNATQPESFMTPSTGTALTDAAGTATIVHRLRFTESGGIECQAAQDLPYADAKVSVYVRGAKPTLNMSVLGVSPTTFTVTFSSAALTPDIGHATMTVTVYDAFGSTVPGIPVFLKHLEAANDLVYSHGSYTPNATCSASDFTLFGRSDALGRAEFILDTRNCTTQDDFVDHLTTAPVFAQGIAVASPTLTMESNFLESYQVTAPTITSVGVAFRSTVTALNVYGRAIPRYNEAGVTLSPLFDGTQVQGTGSLGTSVISFAASPGSVVVSSQTYNKIENIQIKATRGSGNIKTGVSGSLVIQGPAAFTMEIPTGTAAGAVFTGTITAVDSGGTPIVGYGATLSITPVLAASTATPGGGSLTPATVNLPANGKVVVNNLTYSKGEGIRIRVFDSSLNIQGYSSSITVTAPALTISHYSITAPTQVSVGVPFNFQVNALDASSAPVTYSLSRNITVQAFLNGTAISGSGSLGAAAMTLQAGSTYSFTASQTYNKIETVQLRVTDEDGRTGLSGPIVFTGPTQFEVTIPTAAQAGVNFQVVVVARDASNNQVLGYNGTVNLAAVMAANTVLSGGGVLGATSLNVSAGLGSTSFQSYTKAEGIRLRVSDSGIGVTSYSSSATVRAGPAASIALLANPQSTIAGVPSVLTATAEDQYANAVQGATVTFAVQSGSGVVSLSLVSGAVVSAVTSTQAVTDASGQASAFFSSTNTLSAQANLLRASIGALTKDTTVYNSVLITAAGGAVTNFGDPNLRVDCPANTWGFSIRMGVQSRDEIPADTLAVATAAFASQPNTFVSTTVMRVSAVRDSSPSTSAGAGSKLVTVSMPFTVASGSVTVGSYRGQSVLVPLSVLRVFKLNNATSSFEMVLDGTNAVNTASGTVTAEVSDPDGVYAIGAPAFAALSSTQATTVTATVAAGTTAQVLVPAGAFPAGTTLSVGVPSASAIPTLPTALRLQGIGTAISVTAGGAQPSSPVTIRLGYTPAAVAGVQTDRLRLARYDATTGWQILESAADSGNRTVVGTTDHFSLFMIVAVSPGASVAQGFVFPNPFRPSLGHTRIKLANLPPGAKVRIFTATGRLLKELEADAVGQVLGWDGTDRDGRALASGVYLAVVEGEGGRRTIKFAVQR